MKKIIISTLLCAFGALPMLNAQEVTYVQDPSQGVLVNRFQDNWFVSAEGGAGVMFSCFDNNMSLGNRITPSFNLSVGKWFSPIIGLRLGADIYQAKGLTMDGGLGITPGQAVPADGRYEQKFWQMGPAADVLINLTNWWCGYHPGRVYNAVGYVGFSAHLVTTKEANLTGGDAEWKRHTGTNFGTRIGLLNTFSVSKQVDLLLDLKYELAQANAEGMTHKHKFAGYASAMVGVAYKFKKRDWVAPTVPVCPEYKYTDAEGDALVARLQAADSKISSLEAQLNACMNRRPEVVKESGSDAPLATVYFPIGSSKVSAANASLVKAVANAMKSDSSKKYTVKGWADSYTGSAKTNDRLRSARAKAVAKILTRNGVAQDQIEVTTDVNNLTKFGVKSASLDRAVTINEK